MKKRREHKRALKAVQKAKKALDKAQLVVCEALSTLTEETETKENRVRPTR